MIDGNEIAISGLNELADSIEIHVSFNKHGWCMNSSAHWVVK